MAKVTIFWLSHVFNDALVEITITLVSTYVTFYIGEAFLGVSGVLAVVTLGIEINSRRTNISPEVEVFLHRSGSGGFLVFLAVAASGIGPLFIAALPLCRVFLCWTGAYV